MQNKSFKMSAGLEQQQTVIQCPQCQTKFALDPALLADVAAPRFHCSRCDFVFSIEVKAPEKRPVMEVERNTAPFHVPDMPKSPTDPVREEPAATSIPEPTPHAEPLSWSMGLPRNDKPTKSFEVPKATHSIGSFAAPATGGREAFDYSQMNLDFQGSEAPQQAAAPAYRYEEPVAQTSNFGDRVPLSETHSAPPAFVPASAESRWTGLLSIAAPLVLFLSVTIAFSYYLRGNAEGAEHMLASLSRSTPQVAPAQLNILNTKFRHVVLDSGEGAFVVSGTIKNETAETFREIKLEGVGFGDDGVLVSRQRVDLGATLAKTRLRSLTPEMIKNLQSGQLKSKTQLKPGESEEFAFALLDGDASKAHYFSARVYSVLN